MGQHKRNPTAIAAKDGKLPPKERKMGKREADRLIMSAVWARFISGLWMQSKRKDEWY